MILWANDRIMSAGITDWAYAIGAFTWLVCSYQTDLAYAPSPQLVALLIGIHGKKGVTFP